MTDKIRRLPKVRSMRSGPVQFGGDWPGVFIRGDEFGNIVSEAWLLLDLAKKLDAPEKTVRLLEILHKNFKRLADDCHEPLMADAEATE